MKLKFRSKYSILGLFSTQGNALFLSEYMHVRKRVKNLIFWNGGSTFFTTYSSGILSRHLIIIINSIVFDLIKRVLSTKMAYRKNGFK
jgi:hypothetical protein